MLHVPYFSLRQLKLGNTVSLTQVGFPTNGTTVPDIDLLSGLVASRDFRELAHVTYFTSASFLTINPVEAGRLTLLDLFHFMGLVISAERTICLEFHWHFHDGFTDYTDY